MRKLKGVDGKLDIAWSKLVKLRAKNKCEYCGKKTTLNSHHIFSRVNRSVRWDVKNGISLCVKHHISCTKTSAHGAPLSFHKWLTEYRGEKELDMLTFKAHSISKLHDFEKKIMLEELNKEIRFLELNQNGIN